MTRQTASPTQRVMLPFAIITSQSCCRCPTLLLGTSSAVSTSSTPGSASAFSQWMSITLARGYFERTADAYTIPSISTSSGYSPYPSTFSLTSRRKAFFPTPYTSPFSRFASIFSSPRRIAAASWIPSMIFLYPVQRQIFPFSAVLISSSVGSGTRSIKAFPAITIPGMQKPHCTEPFEPKAYTKASFSSSVRPSVVMIFFPAASFVVSTQDFTAFPSTTMVHVPQAPSLQPSLTECR